LSDSQPIIQTTSSESVNYSKNQFFVKSINGYSQPIMYITSVTFSYLNSDVQHYKKFEQPRHAQPLKIALACTRHMCASHLLVTGLDARKEKTFKVQAVQKLLYPFAMRYWCADPLDSLEIRGLGAGKTDTVWLPLTRHITSKPLPERPSGAFANVQLQPMGSNAGFNLHPAVMDSCLHLSGTSVRQTSWQATQTYVPAGFESLSCSRTPALPLPRLMQYNACTVPLGVASQSSATCSFHLSELDVPMMYINDLVSKVLPDLAPQPSESVPAATPDKMMYEVQEQAVQPASAAVRACRPTIYLRPVKLEVLLSAKRSLLASQEAPQVMAAAWQLPRVPPAVAVGHVIGAVQEHLRNGGQGFTIKTAAGFRQAPVGSNEKQASMEIAGSALWGMLRAASTEAPTLTWSGTTKSIAQPPPSTDSSGGSTVGHLLLLHWL
jgi:Polyketide synthase dehydratase